jgi:FtsH-binding integral membrane protein
MSSIEDISTATPGASTMTDLGADPALNSTRAATTDLQAASKSQAVTRDEARQVFGQVMGLVAVTVAFAALGGYLGRNLMGGLGIVLFILAFGCVFALNTAATRGKEQLAVGLLFGFGLVLGLAVGPLLAVYAKADPSVVWQAAGATAAFVALLGAYGYATRRDLSGWMRGLFVAILALVALGIVLLFISIPDGNLIYAIAGIVIFGAFTIFDFNRLRRTKQGEVVPIAASIFLDIFNIFLLFIELFSGDRN